MKLIELTGAPGSGKSTVMPIVKNYFKKQGFDVFDTKSIVLCGLQAPFSKGYFKDSLESLPVHLRNKILSGLNNYSHLKHKYQLKFLLNNSQLFNDIVSLTNARPISDHHKIVTIGWFLNIAASYQIAQEFLGESSVLLLDEGFAHKVITFFVSVEEKTINSIEIERYLEKIPEVHTLIKIEANEDLCKKRLIARKSPRRLKGRTEHEISEYLVKANSALEHVQSFLAKKNTRIIRLNNSTKQFFKESIKSQLNLCTFQSLEDHLLPTY